ncbi:hypothetical protein BDK51DRAFT_37694 [Blyttiomyces helicus]|uniref:Uncharacterized protein n=1 Tax=Blyttiomyces helicus TaxID=388810 RepID=A0A4P9W246_9FUNG|nr:hypothetical protein BDK51DRAFT_37694 [Blyttiomyces helicus]|eukprot:RKO85253.1 hypothetical protein BDK51DRAFT_37694 [Blyttiomyces helicus]
MNIITAGQPNSSGGTLRSPPTSPNCAFHSARTTMGLYSFKDVGEPSTRDRNFAREVKAILLKSRSGPQIEDARIDAGKTEQREIHDADATRVPPPARGAVKKVVRPETGGLERACSGSGEDSHSEKSGVSAPRTNPIPATSTVVADSDSVSAVPPPKKLRNLAEGRAKAHALERKSTVFNPPDIFAIKKHAAGCDPLIGTSTTKEAEITHGDMKNGKGTKRATAESSMADFGIMKEPKKTSDLTTGKPISGKRCSSVPSRSTRCRRK